MDKCMLCGGVCGGEFIDEYACLRRQLEQRTAERDAANARVDKALGILGLDVEWMKPEFRPFDHY